MDGAVVGGGGGSEGIVRVKKLSLLRRWPAPIPVAGPCESVIDDVKSVILLCFRFLVMKKRC